MRIAEATELGRKLLERLPFETGQSPFHIKGVAYRGHLDYCERFVPGGHSAVMMALGNPSVTEFFAQPFLAGSRYDIFPLMLAGYGAARASKQPLSTFLKARARYQVGEDVHGIYRMLLKLVSPELIAKRMPPLIAQYLDFGRASVEIEDEGVVHGAQEGVPLPLVGWYADVTETYMEELLRRAGAKTAEVHYLDVEITGERSGIPLTTMRCVMRFQR